MSFSDFQEALIIIFPAIILILRIVLEVLKDYLDTRDSLAFAEFRKRSSKQIEEKPPDRDIQKELDDILKEAEKIREDLPLVTLWWGLDGLQMKRDGTLEWISKKPRPVEPYWLGPDLIHSYPIPTYPLACMRAYQPILYGLDCQNASPEDRISFLEAQERELTSAMAQSYQTRAILDNLKQWEVVNEEKGSYVKVTDISGNSYLEPCVWTHSQEKHAL